MGRLANTSRTTSLTRLALLLCLLGLSACPGPGPQPFPDDACVPMSCEGAGKQCGTAPDGCGGTLDCGACGYSTCAEMLDAQRQSTVTPFMGPNCAVRMTDLGIAVGSAAKTASIHNVDNRVMYSVGVGALALGWLEGCGVAYGIPLRASGKDIFFDRPR